MAPDLFPLAPEPSALVLCLTGFLIVAPPHRRQGIMSSASIRRQHAVGRSLDCGGVPALPVFCGEAGKRRAEQKVENQSENTMWKKQEGGFKPLWVKCGCGKWNAVQVGAVVKYLDKVLSSSVETPGKPLPEKKEKDSE